jgi:heme/copper-type cytochrome/quinol oxidase subunit 2
VSTQPGETYGGKDSLFHLKQVSSLGEETFLRIRIAGSVLATFVTLVLIGASGSFPRAQEKPPEKPPRMIQVTAKNFEFVPPVIRVKAGEKIQLKLTSVDRTHGIHINPFPDGGQPNTPPGLSFTYGDDCLKLKKDLTATLEFAAGAPGIYSFSCCKKCGTGHGRMKGQIIVEP